jgi:hypothetical protein
MAGAPPSKRAGATDYGNVCAEIASVLLCAILIADDVFDFLITAASLVRAERELARFGHDGTRDLEFMESLHFSCWFHLRLSSFSRHPQHRAYHGAMDGPMR